MAAVFTMQPIGQALAQLVGMWVLLRWNKTHGIDAKQCGLNTYWDDECKQFVDTIWRIVVGSGAIPAVAAIVFRFYLFDSGIYKTEVEDRPHEARFNTYRVYGGGRKAARAALGSQAALEERRRLYTEQQPSERGRNQDAPVQFSKANLHKFFIQDGNYLYLVGEWSLICLSKAVSCLR